MPITTIGATPVHVDSEGFLTNYDEWTEGLARRLAGQIGMVDAISGGRLEVGLLHALVPDPSDREVFICGPDSYRAAARSAALRVGCPSERIHEETFAHSAPVRSDPPSNPTPAGSHRIQFRNHGVTISCASDMTVLEAAAVAGLSLPSSCAQGLCGTCKSTLVSGEVDMRHGGGIRPREIAAGKVLLCCSRPLSDLVIAS